MVEIANTNELEVKLLKQLERDVDNDKQAIKTAQKRMKDNQDVIDALRAKLGESVSLSNDEHAPSQAEMVKKAIRSITALNFSQRDVEREIHNAFPNIDFNPERIRSILWHLQKNNDLILQVKQGNNRSTAEYTKLPFTTHERIAAVNGNVTNDAATRSTGIAGNSGALTVGQLEDFIRRKSRRIQDVAQHFQVSISVVNQLLEPASRVHVATRGWLKIRE